MFSELQNEQGLRSSHLPQNRSVRKGNGLYFAEEKIKIGGGGGEGKSLPRSHC